MGTDLRPSDILSLRFEPGLPSSHDLISGIDLAGSLLIGPQARASLLPQRGSSLVVGTMVPGGSGEDRAMRNNSSAEEKPLWPNFVIGLDDTIHRRPRVQL